MSSQRYRRIATQDEDGDSTRHPRTTIPSSPPPSFHSRSSSRRPSRETQHANEEVNDAFDAPSDDDSEDESPHEQRRLVQTEQRGSPQSHGVGRTNGAEGETSRPALPQRTVTEIPVFAPSQPASRVYGGGSAVHDGVFANLNAKPQPGEEVEEKPPTYEQAAADATPPYWETTVLSPYATTGNPDDVFVDGLLVGSFFSFVWNALISMSFQLIGFLLTYLLHTTHAAKHGSRAGLGITLVQYGFQMRYAASIAPGADVGNPGAPVDEVPDDPNSHNFSPDTPGGDGSSLNLSTGDWLSYVLMIVGWFILIRAVSDYMRARRQEALVRSSPDRGLGVAVIAEGERPETSV